MFRRPARCGEAVQAQPQPWDADDDLPVVGTHRRPVQRPGHQQSVWLRHGDHRRETASTSQHLPRRTDEMTMKVHHPPAKSRYLSEIAENKPPYDEKVKKQGALIAQLYGALGDPSHASPSVVPPDNRCHGLEPQPGPVD